MPISGWLKHLVATPFRGRVGRRLAESAVLTTARLGGLDLLKLAQNADGIGKYQSAELSGESHLLQAILPRLVEPNAVLFDVGANEGAYSRALRTVFSDAAIFAFEPNPRAFKRLQSLAAATKVESVMAALGAEPGRSEIFDYSADASSQHASFFREVFTDLHRHNDVCAIPIEVITLDNFCRERAINRIDFLKIDTEGNELATLRGAANLLAADKIPVIQFEFNEMNVISRCFLKDFYEILPRHRLYRLDTRRLIPVWEYRSRNEIFWFQNFLAVHQSLDGISIA
jgi:FkbM family methyltransferase